VVAVAVAAVVAAAVAMAVAVAAEAVIATAVAVAAVVVAAVVAGVVIATAAAVVAAAGRPPLDSSAPSEPRRPAAGLLSFDRAAARLWRASQSTARWLGDARFDRLCRRRRPH